MFIEGLAEGGGKLLLVMDALGGIDAIVGSFMIIVGVNVGDIIVAGTGIVTVGGKTSVGFDVIGVGVIGFVGVEFFGLGLPDGLVLLVPVGEFVGIEEYSNIVGLLGVGFPALGFSVVAIVAVANVVVVVVVVVVDFILAHVEDLPPSDADDDGDGDIARSVDRPSMLPLSPTPTPPEATGELLLWQSGNPNTTDKAGKREIPDRGGADMMYSIHCHAIVAILLEISCYHHHHHHLLPLLPYI